MNELDDRIRRMRRNDVAHRMTDGMSPSKIRRTGAFRVCWKYLMLSAVSLAVTCNACLAYAEANRSAVFSDDDLQRIDSYIEGQLAQARIPGAALVIVEGDKITHARGYGIAGPDGRPVTAETGFYLGSLTKSFTALAVLQLVEAGKIDLDAPVREYLPWFRVADVEASARMKVSHLLNHTSGFSTYAGRTHLASTDHSPQAIERRVRDLSTTRLTAPVGKGRQYSNANYCVLGAIIESVAEQSYEDYIMEQILEPLDMTSSYTSEDAVRDNQMATGFRYWFGRPVSSESVPRPRGDLPAMFLVSCARDMGNYLLAHMNDGGFGEAHVLSESGISQLHTPERQELNYAMGWITRSIDDVQMLSHTGTTPTFHSEMVVFPAHRKGFALLINAQNQLSGPDVASLGRMVELNMLGIMALPVKKAPRICWNLGLLGALLLGQVIGVGGALLNAYRSYKIPVGRREGKLTRRGLVVMVNIAIVAGMIWWIPQAYEVPFSGILLYAPDAGWLLLFNAGLATASVVVALGSAALHAYLRVHEVNTGPLSHAEPELGRRMP